MSVSGLLTVLVPVKLARVNPPSGYLFQFVRCKLTSAYPPDYPIIAIIRHKILLACWLLPQIEGHW